MNDLFGLTLNEDAPVEKKAAKKVAVVAKPAYTYCDSRKGIVIKECKLSALCVNSDSLHVFKDIVKYLK